MKVKVILKTELPNGKVYQCKEYIFKDFKLSIFSLGELINEINFIKELKKIMVHSIYNINDLTSLLQRTYKKWDFRIYNSSGW